jgi:hypothetical protein
MMWQRKPAHPSRSNVLLSAGKLLGPHCWRHDVVSCSLTEVTACRECLILDCLDMMLFLLLAKIMNQEMDYLVMMIFFQSCNGEEHSIFSNRNRCYFFWKNGGCVFRFLCV